MADHQRQYKLDRQRQHDAHQQANRHRLAKSIHQANGRRSLSLARIYQPTLFHIGRHLEAIGMSLQERYRDLHPSKR